MDRSKKELLKSYKQCIRRVERENDIIGRSRDRKYYYKAKLKLIAEILGKQPKKTGGLNCEN